MPVKQISCTLLGVLFISLSTNAQMAEHLDREIQKIITFDAEIDFKKTPGLLVGVIWGDSSYVFSYGVSSLEDSLPLREDQYFELGELTQVFTAALTVKLAREGLVDLDSSLAGYLQLDLANPLLQMITLRRCLNHSSGLPRFPDDFGEKELSIEDPYAVYTKDDLLHFLEKYDPSKKPPVGFNFSNLNYALVELALEKTLNQPFEEIMEHELLGPLDLLETKFHPPALVQGYDAATNPVSPWSFAAHQGALGLKSTMHDLTKWMHLFLYPPAEWEAVFSELYRQSIPTGIRKNTKMGLGWHLFYPKKRVRILVHTGSTGGSMAYMALDPESKTGVAILANSPYGARGLGLLILGMLNKNWK